jgi:hypothetical protein
MGDSKGYPLDRAGQSGEEVLDKRLKCRISRESSDSRCGGYDGNCGGGTCGTHRDGCFSESLQRFVGPRDSVMRCCCCVCLRLLGGAGGCSEMQHVPHGEDHAQPLGELISLHFLPERPNSEDSASSSQLRASCFFAGSLFFRSASFGLGYCYSAGVRGGPAFIGVPVRNLCSMPSAAHYINGNYATTFRRNLVGLRASRREGPRRLHGLLVGCSL